MSECVICGEAVEEPLGEGACKVCFSSHVYCTICQRWHENDAPCEHLQWNDDRAEWVGPGAE